MRPTVVQAWRECVGGGDFDHHIVNDNCTRDGRLIVCEWFNAPWIDAQGNTVGSFFLVRDVTKQQLPR
jgi:PAS domain-containing protein